MSHHRELEELAATHSNHCASSCPICLAKDLKAKADAVREACAKLLEEEAVGESKRTKDVLAKCARKIRGS